MFQNFIILKLSNIGLVTIDSKLRLDAGMIYHYMSENVKFALQTTFVMSIIICLLVTFLKGDRKLYLKPYFYVKPNNRKYRELFTSTNEATFTKLSKFLAIIMEKFSV